jgi:hypothetical protein
MVQATDKSFRRTVFGQFDLFFGAAKNTPPSWNCIDFSKCLTYHYFFQLNKHHQPYNTELPYSPCTENVAVKHAKIPSFSSNILIDIERERETYLSKASTQSMHLRMFDSNVPFLCSCLHVYMSFKYVESHHYKRERHFDRKDKHREHIKRIINSIATYIVAGMLGRSASGCWTQSVVTTCWPGVCRSRPNT